MTKCHKAPIAPVLFAVVSLVTGCGQEPVQRIALAREPYVGLPCRGPVHPCHELGLAVWLPLAARAVTASVDGRSVRLTTPSGHREQRDRAFWQGFFRDARAERYCDHYPRRLAVTIHVSAANRDEFDASARPIVSCGYG